MARPKIDLHDKIRELLDHSEEAPEESGAPIRHFERSMNDTLSALRYIDDHMDVESIYAAVYERHLAQMRRMALGNLIQAFERFVKETAIVCVDHVARCVHDNRYEKFEADGNSIAINFQAGSIGKALCEGGTWMNIGSVNERFRKALASTFESVWDGWIFAPEKKLKSLATGTPPEVVAARAADEEAMRRTTTVAILFQIRHIIAHNVGLLVGSDAVKLRVFVKKEVTANRVLSPTNDDLRFSRQFLHVVAKAINELVGKRLAELLTELYEGDPTLFDAKTEADMISNKFSMSLTVHGQIGVP
jgi:hypothetical protein